MSMLGNLARNFLKQPGAENRHFLECVRGVVHIGANTGQEREIYDQLGLQVLWIEPIPAIFETLAANIKPFARQRALCALITDRNGAEYRFNIANNEGRSSSILDLKDHRDIWPEVDYVETITLKSTTLTALFEQAAIDPADYGALVMDTQGSELMVLEGCVPLLHAFEYIKTEVSDFEAYAGCCRLADIQAFMRKHGYREVARKKFAERPQGGSYYDVTYRKKALHRILRK